jgi:hypothetical protein
MPGWGSKMTDPHGTSTRAIVLVADAASAAAADADAPLAWRAVLVCLCVSASQCLCLSLSVSLCAYVLHMYRAVQVPPETPENVPNELQCAELPDGTIVLNVRSGNHKLRLLSTSTDVSLSLSLSLSLSVACTHCASQHTGTIPQLHLH